MRVIIVCLLFRFVLSHDIVVKPDACGVHRFSFSKKCAKLFLLVLFQISTNCANFGHKDGELDRLHWFLWCSIVRVDCSGLSTIVIKDVIIIIIIIIITVADLDISHHQ